MLKYIIFVISGLLSQRCYPIKDGVIRFGSEDEFIAKGSYS